MRNFISCPFDKTQHTRKLSLIFGFPICSIYRYLLHIFAYKIDIKTNGIRQRRFVHIEFTAVIYEFSIGLKGETDRLFNHNDGQVISWSSAGKMGFRSSKKNTPYAAQMAAQDCAKVAYDLGLRKVKVYIKGPGNGRESAIRTIHGAGIEVSEIINVTPLPHNGCRPPKRRKV